VLRLHLPIGAGIAVFCALYTLWQKNSVINKKAVVKAYLNGAKEVFKDLPESEQGVFLAQMKERRYDEYAYQEKTLMFMSKVIIGPDYWVYLNPVSSFWVKSGDVTKAYWRDQRSSTATTLWGKREAFGMELIVEHAEGSVVSRKSESAMQFDNKKQAAPVVELIKKHCPHISL